MGTRKPRLIKPTLDKDLEKFNLAEGAARQVSRSMAAFWTVLLFLIVAGVLAGAFALGQPGTLVIIGAAALAAYMAINIGANDVTNNIGAAVGARAMTMGFGLALAAVCEIAGAVIGGRSVSDTIANGIMHSGFIGEPSVLVWSMMAALLSAAVLINLATWFGAPISTTHSMVGGVMGASIAAAGFSAVNWITIGSITASWILSPLLSAVIAAAFLFLLKELIIYRDDKIAAARQWVPPLIGVMAGAFSAYLALVGFGFLVEVSVLSATGLGLLCGILVWRLLIPVVRRQAEGLENRNQSLRKLFRIPLVCAAALLSFAHGANDVSNAIGPLAAIVASVHSEAAGTADIPLWSLLIGGFGISLGVLLFGPKLVRLIGLEITKLNPMRAYCVSLSTALTVIVAAWLGMPVSTTHVAVGAVFGVGFFREWYTRHSHRRLAYIRAKSAKFAVGEPLERNDNEVRRRLLVRRSHFMSILAAWTITLPLAAGLSAIFATIMFAIFL
ncbi:MAG: anion permease [Pseudomonadota bacterium]|nr:anion permease [Pseudomonadota bacterium]